MDQFKSGKFIAELRKSHGMTQLQLAEKLGVSDKTVSRWECGKGMPELSILMPLCEILEINVNELLSGESLTQESYSQKAEENMLNLIQTTAVNKVKNSYSIISVFLSCIVIATIIMFTLLQGGVNGFEVLDYMSFLLVLIPAILYLLMTGLWKDFLNAFNILFFKKEVILSQTVIRAKEAVDLISRTTLSMGLLLSLIQIFTVLYLSGHKELLDVFRSLSITFLTLLYGIIIYLILIPVRSKLNMVSNSKQ